MMGVGATWPSRELPIDPPLLPSENPWKKARQVGSTASGLSSQMRYIASMRSTLAPVGSEREVMGWNGNRPPDLPFEGLGRYSVRELSKLKSAGPSVGGLQSRFTSAAKLLVWFLDYLWKSVSRN